MVIIDGCPPGLILSENDIQKELDAVVLAFRSRHNDVKQTVKILSGVFEGKPQAR